MNRYSLVAAHPTNGYKTLEETMYVDDYLREDSGYERPRRLRQGMFLSIRRKKESRHFPEAVGGSKVIIE